MVVIKRNEKTEIESMRKICLHIVYTCMEVASCSTVPNTMKMRNKIFERTDKGKNAVKPET